MARKHQLRKQRAGTVINLTSSKQETRLGKALHKVEEIILNEFDITLKHDKTWKLTDIIRRLREAFPKVEFHCHHNTSSIRPDGGILSICRNNDHELYPILITEVKNQGTNDLRLEEGKPKQAKGNAIERLGKNVIGIRTAMRSEGIVPFVCFGDGCDFAPDSSILDRVSTIAMFGNLNATHLKDVGPHNYFDRGSFYFRHQPWTEEEMIEVMSEIARRSIYYYFSKYGKDAFIKVAD